MDGPPPKARAILRREGFQGEAGPGRGGSDDPPFSFSPSLIVAPFRRQQAALLSSTSKLVHSTGSGTQDASVYHAIRRRDAGAPFQDQSGARRLKRGRRERNHAEGGRLCHHPKKDGGRARERFCLSSYTRAERQCRSCPSPSLGPLPVTARGERLQHGSRWSRFAPTAGRLAEWRIGKTAPCCHSLRRG